MKKLLYISSIIIFIFGIISCSKVHDNISDSAKVFKTKSGKTIVITETHPAGLSLSTINITTKSFEYNYNETFVDADPVTDVFMADLDENGFDEIYIITTSAGSGSYGTVLAFASNKDKSLSIINFQDHINGEANFLGYMGHDIFVIENNKLKRTFPIYNEEDINANPTGEKRELVYGLFPGETMWQLRIVESVIVDVAGAPANETRR